MGHAEIDVAKSPTCEGITGHRDLMGRCIHRVVSRSNAYSFKGHITFSEDTWYTLKFLLKDWNTTQEMPNQVFNDSVVLEQ